jgi:hypothetical protein
LNVAKLLIFELRTTEFKPLLSVLAGEMQCCSSNEILASDACAGYPQANHICAPAVASRGEPIWPEEVIFTTGFRIPGVDQ